MKYQQICQISKTKLYSETLLYLLDYLWCHDSHIEDPCPMSQINRRGLTD